MVALRRLQRLTGRATTVAPAEWTSWWEQSRPSFRSRRALATIPVDALETFSISFRGTKVPGGEPMTISAGLDGLGAAAAGPFPLAQAELEGMITRVVREARDGQPAPPGVH